MRLTMNQSDPAYNPAANWDAKIFLNGNEVKMCIEADEEQGYVIRYVERKNWPEGWNPGERDEWPTEKLTGKVKIRLKLNG
jgi:hypothetical protein